MTGPGTWWLRVGLAVVGFAGLEATLLATGSDPDELRLALVVALVVGIAGLVLDATPVEPAEWPVHASTETGLSRLDPRTATYLRILESHLATREPDAALRDRLRTLTDHALRTRHDLALDDPRAASLVGAELGAVLDAPPERLDPQRIERCVRRIEEL